jgi:uncharacterized protein (TIRG00374 family)
VIRVSVPDAVTVAQGNRRPERSGRWLQLAKLLVTLGTLAFLLTRVPLGELAEAFRGALWPWLALALVANSLLLVTSTWKWQRLLIAIGIEPGFWVLFRSYTIGFFFSSFLPGTVGGDVARWHAASSDRHSRLKVAATILVERITGVVALVTLCLLFVAWKPLLATPPTLVLIGAIGAAVVAALWLGFSPKLTAMLERLARGRSSRLLGPAHRLHQVLSDVPTKAVFASVGYSLPFYASGGLLFFLIGRAFGAEIGLLEAAAVQTLICLLTLIPISLGGLGLAQAGDVYLLGLLGVDAPTALGMSLLRQGLAYAYAALGALFFARWQGHPSVSELRSLSGEPHPGPGSNAASRVDSQTDSETDSEASVA